MLLPKLWHRPKKMKRFSLNKEKLLLAFEMGVVLADVAKAQGVEVTPELVKRMEDIILSEFGHKSASKLACEMNVLLLAAFETK